MNGIDVNSKPTVIWVTAIVAVMVLMLPWLDRKISSRLGLNLHGGLSRNPDADRLLRVRQGILTFGILVYLVVFAYLVFFSRNAMEQYAVHVAPLQDLRDAFSTDYGFSDVIRRIFTEGFTEAFRNVRLVRPDDLIQFYLNIVVFIPLGNTCTFPSPTCSRTPPGKAPCRGTRPGGSRPSGKRSIPSARASPYPARCCTPPIRMR